MNNIYDNGEMLIGNVKNIKQHILNSMLENEDDEQNMGILEDIQELEDTTIVSINYDNGMGWSIDYWNEKDKVVL